MSRAVWAMGTLAVLLAGCAAPATHQSVTPVAPVQMGLAGGPAPYIDQAWWRSFGDPQLDRLVADATGGNPSLATALARVRQAQAGLERQQAERNLDVSADLSPQVQRLSGRYIIPPPYGGSVRFVGTGVANLSYNLDLFGRQQAAILEARQSAQAARYDVAAARLAIAGSVVQTYLDLVRADAQAAIARATITERERSLRLVESQVRNQLASKVQSTAAATLLAQAREALTAAEGSRALAVNALAALAGRGGDYAAGIGPTAARLDAGLPVPTVLPADLLARRPDIAAAQARIAAAAAGQQVARRAYYPNVNLTALAGLQAIGIGNLFSLDAGTAGGGGAIHLPIFEGGRLRAGLESATAQVDLANAAYNERVVGAVREAADALALSTNLQAQRQRAEQVVRGFAETGRLNAVRVSSGLNSQLDLVDNDVRLLDARLTATNLAAEAARQRVALVLALGGGFSAESVQP